MISHKFHEFLQTHFPWQFARYYYVIPARLRRMVRGLRYRRPPKEGWGEGWRMLIFRQSTSPRRLHVLAPVKGLEFDWDLLKLFVRGEVLPDHSHECGVSTANMAWGGHHIYVVNDEIGAQRIPMDKLVPGKFRGGVGMDLVLLDVRVADLPRQSPAVGEKFATGRDRTVG